MAVGKDWDELLQKYKNRLETEFGDGEFDESKPILTKNYADFKKESMTAQLTYYEKMCNWSEKILNLKPDAKKAPTVQRQIDTCHLNVTPAGTTSFSILFPLIFMLVGGGLGYVLSQGQMFFLML